MRTRQGTGRPQRWAHSLHAQPCLWSCLLIGHCPHSNCVPVIKTACIWVSEHRMASHLTPVINIIYTCIFSSLRILHPLPSLENYLLSRSQLNHVPCMKRFSDVSQGPRAPSPPWHCTRMGFLLLSWLMAVSPIPGSEKHPVSPSTQMPPA